MALEQTWQTLSEALIAAPLDMQLTGSVLSPRMGNAAPTPLPGSWHALFSSRARPLLLPAHNRAAQRSGLKFFVGDIWNLLYAHTMLKAHYWLPRRELLPTLSLPLMSGPGWLEHLLLSEAPQLAFLIGTPGPYQKASILIMSPQGKPLLFVKLALTDSADAMIEREAYWLQRLGQCTALQDMMPRLLGSGRVRNGRHYVVTSVAQGSLSSSSFTAEHARFLRTLALAEMRTQAFDDSAMYHYWRRCLAEMRAGMRDEQQQLLTSAISECLAELMEWHGFTVIAHGDFAAWNIRSNSRTTIVFDWEYASDGALPLLDPLHFLLIPAASSGRGVTSRDLKQALVQIGDYAKVMFPQYAWPTEVVAAQALAYFIQTILFYSQSRGEVPEDHPVVRTYCRLIAERAQWRQWSN